MTFIKNFFSREEGKSLGGLGKNGRRYLGIMNKDNSFEDSFYKRVRHGSIQEGQVGSKGALKNFFNMGEMVIFDMPLRIIQHRRKK